MSAPHQTRGIQHNRRVIYRQAPPFDYVTTKDKLKLSREFNRDDIPDASTAFGWLVE